MDEIKREKCAILSLVLKGKWYDMIENGGKQEEYRDATKYWRIRLNNWDKRFTANNTPVVEFRRGYAHNAPRMAFWCLGLEPQSGERRRRDRKGPLRLFDGRSPRRPSHPP